jgi:hypothetical protein
MEPQVWVALITALAGLAVAVASILLQQRAARQTKTEERRSQAKAVLDRYRGPLLTAAWELGDRIDNIRHRAFSSFAAEGSGRESATKLTTLFRFAQYFGWREVLRREVQLLRYEAEESTRRVANLISDTNWAFATDKLDRKRAMIWSEEQRAIGELMILEDKARSTDCLGYAAFVEGYDVRFSRWMDKLAEDVLSSDAPKSDRLRLLQWALCGLVHQLDEEKIYDRNHPWLVRVRSELETGQGSQTPSELEDSIRTHLAPYV